MADTKPTVPVVEDSKSTEKKRGSFKSFSIKTRKGKPKGRPVLAAFKKSPSKSRVTTKVASPEKLEKMVVDAEETSPQQKQATNACREARRLPSWRRFSETAVMLCCRGNFKQAATQFANAVNYLSVALEAKKEEDRLVVDHFEAAKVYEQYAQTLNELGQFYQALNMAKKAVELAPQWADAHQTLYRAQLNWGDPEKALQTAKNALMHTGDESRYQEIRDETAAIEDICTTMREDDTPTKDGKPGTKAKGRGSKRGRPMGAVARQAKEAKLQLKEKEIRDDFHEQLKNKRDGDGDEAKKEAMDGLRDIYNDTKLNGPVNAEHIPSKIEAPSPNPKKKEWGPPANVAKASEGGSTNEPIPPASVTSIGNKTESSGDTKMESEEKRI